MVVRGSIIIFVSSLALGFAFFAVGKNSVSLNSLISSKFATASEERFIIGVKDLSLLNNGILRVEEMNHVVRKVAKEIKAASVPFTLVISSVPRLPENQNKTRAIKINNSISELKLSAKSALALDLEDDIHLFEKEIDVKTPIASISKLMTALVFLDYNPGWDEIYEIKKEDRREGGKIYLYWGEKIEIKDLFNLSLVASANTATMALVHSTGFSEEEFVAKMNEKAQELDLKNTYFYDPVGLHSGNVSTAREVAQMAKEAFFYPDIREATLLKECNFKTLGGKNKCAQTTDYLLEIFPQNGVRILGGKTGRTEAAGYCFVGQFTSHDGQDIISVILGAESNNKRFKETKELVEWVYKNYYWK